MKHTVSEIEINQNLYIYIYIYIYVCVCVCILMCLKSFHFKINILCVIVFQVPWKLIHCREPHIHISLVL